MFSYIKLNNARDDDKWGTNDDNDACFDNNINLFVDYRSVLFRSFIVYHILILIYNERTGAFPRIFATQHPRLRWRFCRFVMFTNRAEWVTAVIRFWFL